MNAGDVPSLVRAYEDGIYTFAELAAVLLRWSRDVPLAPLAAQLPEPLEERFRELMRDLYDNDRPADAFVSVNDAPMTEEVLNGVRSWLAGDG